MNRRGWIAMACGLIFALTQGIACAQSTGSTASNVPILASGQMPATNPRDDVEMSNIFKGAISVGSFFDDNASIGSTPRQWNLNYFIMPSVTFEETRARFVWGLMYAPGFVKSQNLSNRNQFSQNFGGHFTWLPTRHSTLSVQQNYIRSDNPFQQFATSPGPTISPNQTIFFPSLMRTSILSNAEYSYQFAEHSSIGLGGSFASQHSDTTPHSGPATSLIRSQIATGNAYYSHQFSARNQLGVQYETEVMRFPVNNARTTTHMFQVFDQMRITPNTTFTVYGGPEYSLTFNQVEVNLGFIIITIPVRENGWHSSGGVIYSWTGQHVAVNLDYTRRISDGGGLVGAVKLNAGTANFSWRLTNRWSLTAGLAGADDQLLAVQSAQNELRTYSARVGLQRQLSKNFSMNMSYERLNETGGLAGLPTGNHDLASASLVYSFLKPLGR